MSFHDEIQGLFTTAASVLEFKDRSYGSSWKKRGGVGAFMMLARKWDRIELAAQKKGWDIFLAVESDPVFLDEGLLDDIRDMRNYLTLVEHEMTYVRKTNGLRESHSSTSSTPSGEESSGATPPKLGLGDHGDSKGP